MPLDLHKVRVDLKHHGILPVAEDIALRGINHVVFLKVFHCMKFDAVKPEFLAAPEGYRGMLLNSGQLTHYASLAEYELPRAFVDEACAKGDQCYGLFAGDVLAAYQWYTIKPTNSGWRGIIVSFDNQYVYMYKAFTHPNHRGNRLYPVGVTTMLAASLARGYKGLLCLVEATNFASLKACYRMGFTDCGRLYAALISDRFMFHGDPASRQFSFRLTRSD